MYSVVPRVSSFGLVAICCQWIAKQVVRCVTARRSTARRATLVWWSGSHRTALRPARISAGRTYSLVRWAARRTTWTAARWAPCAGWRLTRRTAWISLRRLLAEIRIALRWASSSKTRLLMMRLSGASV